MEAKLNWTKKEWPLRPYYGGWGGGGGGGMRRGLSPGNFIQTCDEHDKRPIESINPLDPVLNLYGHNPQ